MDCAVKEGNMDKDKKEIKKSNWYDKLQKPIRIIGILVTAYCTLKLPSIKPINRFLDFDMLEPVGIDMIHGGIFGSYVSEVVSTLSQGVTVALGAALVSFILAWIWEMFDNDTWYKYQNIGLGICGFTGLYYPIANLLLGGGTLNSNGVIIFCYVVLVIIAVTVAVYNIVKFGDKKDVYASEKKLLKKGPMILILVASMVAFVYPVVNLIDGYIEVNEIRQLIEKHPENYREEIEEQMGNYAMATAFSFDGEIYVADKIKGEDCWGVFQIDEDGNYELIWRIEESGIVDRLVVYDGYAYVGINDGSNNKRRARIVRCPLGGTNQETVVAFDGMVDFGISDNQLIYYEFLDRSGNLDDYGTVYTVDLEKPFDDSNKVLYDKKITFRHFDRESWMNILLYNKHDDYYRYYDEFPQSYENSTLYINDHRDLIKNVYPAEPVDGTYDSDYYSHAIDSNVYAFNVYDGRIYYVKAANDDDREKLYSDNELWSCNLYGEDRKKIGVFPSDSGVENEVHFICEGIYVTDDYVVCDFYRGKNGTDERYLMQIDTGLYKKLD